MLGICIFQMIAQNGLRSKANPKKDGRSSGAWASARPRGGTVVRSRAYNQGMNFRIALEYDADAQAFSAVYSGVILVQKSVYSMVSKSPTTSKICPSRIRMYHV